MKIGEGIGIDGGVGFCETRQACKEVVELMSGGIWAMARKWHFVRAQVLWLEMHSFGRVVEVVVIVNC